MMKQVNMVGSDLQHRSIKCSNASASTISPMPLPGFHGRTEELAWLRGLWDACTARDPSTGRFVGGPRAAFIIAESGIGKSRLVQALYQQLTTDPAWDPPEVDYWPDAFNDQGVKLGVVPDMSDHVAKGPPQFAWLGARWKPTDERNVSDRRSVLPELRQSIMVHAEILRRQGSLWQDATGRIHEAIRRDGIGEVIEQVADSAVPFGGLLMKLAKGAMDLAKDRRQGQLSAKQADKAQAETFIDEVCECLHSLVDGAGGLPTILWLDDAQWIDAETQLFLRRIWRTAEQRRWPLLVVVTHWEREWRELKQASAQAPRVAIGAPTDLCWLDGEPGVEVRILKPAGTNALAEYLGARLTGLTLAQRELMLDKAAGNFLTLVENVGHLLRVPQNFVDRDVAKPLSTAGERKVREWESDRQKRVEQRFTELAPGLQEMLCWGSHLGVSFLREVVEEYAERVSGMRGAPDRLREAVDPLVILGEPSEHLREFRDRAFHHVARRHFEDYGQEHAHALDTALRERLIEWVNNSFDEDGNDLWPDPEKGIKAPPRSVTGLTNEEARHVLSMAVRCLPIPENPEWNKPADAAALRAKCLTVVVDKRENLWDRVKSHCQSVALIPWHSVPSRVLSAQTIDSIAATAEISGALDTALEMRRVLLETATRVVENSPTAECRLILCKSLDATAALEREQGSLSNALQKFRKSLEYRRELAQALHTHDSQRDLGWSLNYVAEIEQAYGNLDAALERYQESLEIFRALVETQDTPDLHRDVSVSLENVARIEATRGDLDAALAKYKESLEISRDLAEVLRTPQSRRDLSLSLGNVAEIEHARGDLDAALAKYKESLEISRDLAEVLRTPQSRRDLSLSLHNVAQIERTRGDLDAALAKYKEGLEISRDLAEVLRTPQSQRDVSLGLEYIAQIEATHGRLDAALGNHHQSLEIRRVLAEFLRTPESQRDVSVSLQLVAQIEETRGDLDAALAKYIESLEISRDLAEVLRTPQSRRDLSQSLDRMAEIEHARGDLDAVLARYHESLEIRRVLAEVLRTPESQRDVSVSLQLVAQIEATRGDLDAALAKYIESLEISRDLAEVLRTPQSRRDIGQSLDNVAEIEHARGDLDCALAKYHESLEIRRDLAEVLRTPQSRRDLSLSLNNVAQIEHARGDLDAALAKYHESLEIRRVLAEVLRTPESQRDVSVSLENVARIEATRGDLDAALARYEESLQIRRSLTSEETPAMASHRALTLHNMGFFLQTRGDVDAAQARYEESLQIRRSLTSEETPAMASHRALTLHNMGWLLQTRGDVDAALVKFEESLKIRRRSFSCLGTSESHHQVALALDKLAEIARAHGDLTTALTRYEESLAIKRTVSLTIGTTQSQRDIALGLDNLSNIEFERGRFTEAIPWYRESLQIKRNTAKDLWAPVADHELRGALTSVLTCTSNASLQMIGWIRWPWLRVILRRPDPRPLLIAAIPLAQELAEIAPMSAMFLEIVAEFWTVFAKACAVYDDRDSAERYASQASVLRARISSLSKHS